MSRNHSSKIVTYGPDMAEYLELLGFESPAFAESDSSSELHSVASLSAEGNPQAKLMFISESPLNGPAAELLGRMVQAMGFGMNDVYIVSLEQKEPAQNETSLQKELQDPSSDLNKLIQSVSAEALVTLGQSRGKSWELKLGERLLAVFPTFHPALLLENAARKKDTWEDLKQVMSNLSSKS